MSPPMVSIIVPAFNAAPWLKQTLESALAQTHPAIEIIVVDDGSRDDTLAIGRAFASRSVRVLSQPNRGASAARNHGLRQAQGDFIQFLDADDLLAPDKIARQIERLQREAPGTVASAAWVRFHADIDERPFAPEPAWRDFTSPVDFLVLHYNEGWMMPPIAWLTPRQVIDCAGTWDERLSLNDDGEYFCRVLLAGSGIAWCSDARCYYRSGLAGSLSRQQDAKALRSLRLSIELNTAAMLAHADSPPIRAALANAWSNLGYELYPVLAAESKAAAARAREFGRPTRNVEMGYRLRLLSRFVGWRLAKRIQYALQMRRSSSGSRKV